MKKLTTYISHVKDLHSLNEYLNEKLVVNQNYSPYTCAPSTLEELRKIIEDRVEKEGFGTAEKPIDFNDIDISNIDSFYNVNINEGIFEGTEFEYIDISDWDVSKVKDMYRMFNECYNLKSASDLSNWDVSKVKDMSFMFDSCINLKSVGNLSKWNVSECENMHCMFDDCEKLKSVGNLSKWDISKVKDMSCMFEDSGIKNTPSWYEE